MGLIIHDSITFNNGVSASGTYLSFFNQSVTITPGVSPQYLVQQNYQSPSSSNIFVGAANVFSDVQYTINCMYRIWLNQAVRESGGESLKAGSVTCPITKDQLSQPIFGILYEYIKQNMYANASDEI